MLYSFLLFIFLTIIFFIVIGINKNVSRCHGNEKDCFDGNGYYQYKGRGKKNESVEILLSRIDWLAKNSCNGSLYTTSYIISYAILLATILILYSYSNYIVSPFEIILILASNFITVFSILNLFSFHTDKYPNYYIRRNIEYLSKQFNLSISDPPPPSLTSKVPHRTKVQDILSK
jgi:hypothetical protein